MHLADGLLEPVRGEDDQQPSVDGGQDVGLAEVDVARVADVAGQGVFPGVAAPVVGSLLDRQWVLDAVDADADAERDDAGVLAEVHPVDHECDQVQVIEAAGHQVGQRGLGRGHEPAGHRRLGGGGGLRLDGLPAGLEPVGVAAGGQAASIFSSASWPKISVEENRS